MGHFDRQGRPHKRDLQSWIQLYKLPHFPFEHFVSVDNFPIWRRHLAWSKSSGKEMRDLVTQRFGSNMVFMSLQLATGLAVLFSPSDVTTTLRYNLRTAEDPLQFALGLILFLSIISAIFALVSTFAIWAVISTVGDANVHTIIRSSVGLLATQLPSRVISVTIVLFLTWILLWLFVLLPERMLWLSIVIASFSVFLYWYVTCTASALGRLIMHTGAMGEDPIFDVQEAESKHPFALFSSLTKVAEKEKAKKSSVMSQYRTHTKHSFNRSVMMREGQWGAGTGRLQKSPLRVGSRIPENVDGHSEEKEEEVNYREMGDLENGIKNDETQGCSSHGC